MAITSSDRSTEIAPIIYPGQRPFHVLEAQQFSKEWLTQDLFSLTEDIKAMSRRERANLLPKINGFNLFYEASTRTRTSFAQAIRLLGGTSEGTENARAFSSVTKGETLEDTIQILSGYEYDYIVLRYDKVGGARRAALVSPEVPIINAGDGKGQHPTQALLDVYTIQSELGKIGNQQVAFVGDLERGRTVHSAVYLLSKFPGMKFDFASPSDLKLPQEIKDYLDRHNIFYRETDNIDDILPEADVVYMTRDQKERSKNTTENTTEEKSSEMLNDHEPSGSFNDFGLNEARVAVMQADARILHPLPRNKEIPFDLDSDPRNAIFRQAKNGLYVRMALLYMINQSKVENSY